MLSLNTAAQDGKNADGSAEDAVPKDEDEVIADRLREGLQAEMQSNNEGEPAPESSKKKKEKKEKPPKEKKEKQPVDPVALWKIFTVAAAVVALALGFCVCLLMFTDTIKSGNEQFAIRSANALNSKLPMNTELYVYKAYVNNGTLADECMLYTMTSYGGNDKISIYRIVVEKDAPSIVNIYSTIDPESPEILAMKASEDNKIRIQASQLIRHSDDIYEADREIQINSPNWEKIDCTKINRNITSEQSK